MPCGIEGTAAWQSQQVQDTFVSCLCAPAVLSQLIKIHVYSCGACKKVSGAVAFIMSHQLCGVALGLRSGFAGTAYPAVLGVLQEVLNGLISHLGSATEQGAAPLCQGHSNTFASLSCCQDYQAIVDAEWNILYDKLDKIHKSGAKVVLSKLPIGDVATQYFADRDMFCAGRVPEEDLKRTMMVSTPGLEGKYTLYSVLTPQAGCSQTAAH